MEPGGFGQSDFMVWVLHWKGLSDSFKLWSWYTNHNKHTHKHFSFHCFWVHFLRLTALCHFHSDRTQSYSNISITFIGSEKSCWAFTYSTCKHRVIYRHNKSVMAITNCLYWCFVSVSWGFLGHQVHFLLFTPSIAGSMFLFLWNISHGLRCLGNGTCSCFVSGSWLRYSVQQFDLFDRL